MARAAQDKPYNTFINGLITEATGLTFPENALKDVDNCDIELRGSVRRRLGITQEAGGVVIGEGSLSVQTYSNDTGGPLSASPSISGSGFTDTVVDQDDYGLLAAGNGHSSHAGGGEFNMDSTDGGYGAIQKDYTFTNYDLIEVSWTADENTSNEVPLDVVIGCGTDGLGQGLSFTRDGLRKANFADRTDDGRTYITSLNSLNYDDFWRVTVSCAKIGAGLWACTIVTRNKDTLAIADIRSTTLSFSSDRLEFRAASSQSHTGNIRINTIVVQASVAEVAGDTTTVDVPSTDLAISRHIWKNPAGIDGKNWIVFQVGNQLFFRDHERETISSLDGATVPLGSEVLAFDGVGSGFIYNTTSALAAQQRLHSVPGNGRLWFTSPAVIPFYAEYDVAADSIVLRPNGYQATGTDAELTTGARLIRDFNGVVDNLDNDEQPITLTQAHLYNLLNQGWNATQIDAYKTEVDTYPSNAQQWILGKNPDEDFDPALLTKQDFGNGLAPRGRRVLDALVGTKDGISHSVVGVDSPIDFDTQFDERSTTGWTAVGFYAGRVWYAGDTNLKRPNGVYFSKTLASPRDSGTFMQEQDPTSEHFSDLLATDGGVIYIPEAERILKLAAFGAGILIMAANGIWMIHGGDAGFSATNYVVEKISATGVLSPDTVIQTEQSVVFWADNGIHVLALPQSGIIPVVQDVSATKVFTYYARIPLAARLTATGAFDSVTKKVVWFWLSNVLIEPGNLYDRALIYDTRTSAFTPYSIAVDIPGEFGVAGAFPRLTPTTSLSEQVVTLSTGEPVTVDGDYVTVVAPSTTPQELQNSLKLIIIDGTDDGLRLAEFSNRLFFDFLGFENSDTVEGFFDSYAESGTETLGDLQRDKKATFVHSFFARTESGFIDDGVGNLIPQDPSAAVMVARWDWHNTGTGHRWSRPQAAYRYRKPYAPVGLNDTFDTGEGIIYTKLKARGKGRALNVRYESEDGKDFQLLGFSVPFTANGV